MAVIQNDGWQDITLPTGHTIAGKGGRITCENATLFANQAVLASYVADRLVQILADEEPPEFQVNASLGIPQTAAATVEPAPKGKTPAAAEPGPV